MRFSRKVRILVREEQESVQRVEELLMRLDRERKESAQIVEGLLGRLERKLSLTDDTVYIGNAKFYIPNFPLDLIQSCIAGGHYFEEETLRYLDKYLSRESVVFDLGANIGNHSIYWSKVTDGAGVKRVYAFEPVDLTFSILRKNIEINGLGNKVILNRVGLGKKEGSAELYNVYDYSNIGATALRAVNGEEEGTFKIITLDSYIKSTDFRDNRIDMIKIDVEGFEEDVLLGARKTLEKYSPIIYIEAWPHNFGKIDRLLNSLGYKLEKDLGVDNYLYIRQNN
jgi:FkbM family methyltransferase